MAKQDKKTSEMTKEELHKIPNEALSTEKKPDPVVIEEDENVIRIDYEDRKLAFLNFVSSGLSPLDAIDKMKVKFNKAELNKLRGK